MSRNIVMKAKERPRWYQFRWNLSSRLVRLANKIHPNNPDVTAFYAQAISDYMIYGKHIVRINPEVAASAEKESNEPA